MPGNWKKKTFVPVDHFPDFNLESATIIIKNMFIMKNLTDFRKTVETGLDPRLFTAIHNSIRRERPFEYREKKTNAKENTPYTTRRQGKKF